MGSSLPINPLSYGDLSENSSRHYFNQTFNSNGSKSAKSIDLTEGNRSMVYSPTLRTVRSIRNEYNKDNLEELIEILRSVISQDLIQILCQDHIPKILSEQIINYLSDDPGKIALRISVILLLLSSASEWIYSLQEEEIASLPVDSSILPDYPIRSDQLRYLIEQTWSQNLGKIFRDFSIRIELDENSRNSLDEFEAPIGLSKGLLLEIVFRKSDQWLIQQLRLYNLFRESAIFLKDMYPGEMTAIEYLLLRLSLLVIDSGSKQE